MLHVKLALIAAGSVAVFLAGACPLSAQQLHGFVTPGIHSDLNNEHFAGVGSGLLFDWLDSRISVGAKADLFISGGYFAGRGGPIGQFNFIRSRGLRPFAIGGIAWGENDGPMLGGGVEFWPQGPFGFRATVEDYFNRIGGLDCARFGYSPAECDARFNGGRPHTAHQLSVYFGLAWR